MAIPPGARHVVVLIWLVAAGTRLSNISVGHETVIILFVAFLLLGWDSYSSGYEDAQEEVGQ